MCHKAIKEARQMLQQFANTEEIKEENNTKNKENNQKQGSQEHKAKSAKTNQIQTAHVQNTTDPQILPTPQEEQVWTLRFDGSR